MFFYRTPLVAASEQIQAISVDNCVAKWCSGHLAQIYLSYSISCYNDSLCLHEYSKMIGLNRKRHLFGAEKLKRFLLLSGIDISGKR